MTAPHSALLSPSSRPGRVLNWNTRARLAAICAIACIVCFAIYWRGVFIWFHKDDFAWLNLHNQVTSFRSFVWTLFAPLAQGTIRPLSERIPFLLSSWLFGMNPLPLRVLAFINQFVNLALLIAIARKLTRSDAAALGAAIAWAANPALVTAMSWSAAYNEIQCAGLMLLAFWFLLRYTESGDARFHAAEWITFLIGFGSLEVNVVYPAIAATYCLLFSRRNFRRTLPMFIVSAVYIAIDRWAGAANLNFYYRLDFRPASLLRCLGQYLKLLAEPFPHAGATAALLTTGALLFIVWRCRRRDYLPLFAACWYLIVLAPVLPLSNHVSSYYQTIPAIGVALFIGSALRLAFQSGIAAASAAAVLTFACVLPCALAARSEITREYEIAERGRVFVEGVLAARNLHPGKTLLIRHADDTLFWEAVYDSPFAFYGWHNVFLTPESRSLIRDNPHLDSLNRYFLPDSAARQVLESGDAIVYEIHGSALRNVTRTYLNAIESRPVPKLAAEVDAGLPYFAGQLGQGWYELESGHRWCGKHAVVYLPGPRAAAERLHIRGTAPAVALANGPVELSVSIEGGSAERRLITHADSEFEFDYDVPPALRGRAKITVQLSVNRTFRTGADDRDLGLVFGRFEIR